MKAKRIITITIAIIIAIAMSVSLIACGNNNNDNDNDSPDRQTDDSTDAASESENGYIIEPELVTEELSVEIEALALTVDQISGIVNLSRPLRASITHHFDTTTNVEIPNFVWDDDAEHNVWVGNDYIDIELNGEFEGTERVALYVMRDDNRHVVGDINISGSVVDEWGYTVMEITPQSFVFNLWLWDSPPAGTYTFYLMFSGYAFNISNVPELADSLSYKEHYIGTSYDFELPIMKFEYNPEQLAIDCDFIEIMGLMHSPFSTSLSLNTWHYEYQGSKSFDNESFALLDLEKFTYLTRLDLSGTQISDLTPIAGLTNLEVLNMGTAWRHNNEEDFLVDVTPLGGLKNLKELYLSGQQISDLTPLANLTNLESLNLSRQLESYEDEHGHLRNNNILTDITPLAGLTNLRSLDLSENQISDLTPLANLTNLESLDLREQRMIYEDNWGSSRNDTLLSDITPLRGLTNLIDLDLRENRISDVTPLSNLINLESLKLDRQWETVYEERWGRRENTLSDIAPLAGLISLKELFLNENRIIDITSLSGLTSLESLYLREQWEFSADGRERLSILSDITPLVGLTSLEYLDLFSNKISALPPLDRLTNLIGLNLSRNVIFDIAPLRSLPSLTGLGLSDNSLILDYSPLGAISNLSSLDLSYSHIRDISSLAGLININSLYLEGNEIFDITPLRNLTNLTTLSLNNNQLIMDFAPLSELLNLEILQLDSTHIKDISPLAGLTELTRLSLSRNQITDLTPLAGLTNLNSLSLSGNDDITDWSPVAHVNNVWGRP
jgi:internalin A